LSLDASGRPGSPGRPLRVGVLASQGDFAAHLGMLAGLCAEPVAVRTAPELEGLDALVIPGGESTTIMNAIERDGLRAAIQAHVEAGRALLGTCAGMIVCDRNHLGLADVAARRNAFGRQLSSFEEDLVIDGLGPEPLRAVFIRAPWLEELGPDVEVLASINGHPIAVRDRNVVLVAFHPELTEDSRVHAYLMAVATSARDPVTEQATG